MVGFQLGLEGGWNFDRVHGWWEEIWDYPGSIFRYKLPPAQRFSVAFPGGMLFETGTRFRAVLQ